MAAQATTFLLLLSVLLGLSSVVVVRAEDPYIFFTWNISLGTISPLGVPQKGILINGEFPGPNINSTTNNNVVINVFNNLQEPFLFSWNGIQLRKNSWQDGMPGTNCPIPPGTNFTYHFQVKDQIGSYFYFPSMGMHKAAGAFGGLRVNSRLLIPVPFPDPADDYTVLIGDWYTKNYDVLARNLDSGRGIGLPKGVLINGKSGKDSTGKDDPPLFEMEAGKTYRYRICNIGLRASLNFRVQGHSMKLVEMDGSHTVQNMYNTIDVHTGQCYSVLITANQKPMDYYMVASTRFMKKTLTTTSIVRYTGSNTPPSPDLPPAPPANWGLSLNQWRSFRWNLTASAARPNPQGSYHYGSINITRTIKLGNSRSQVDGKTRYAINGVSHVDADTPLKLAEYFGIADKVFKYNLIGDVPPVSSDIKIATNVISAEFRTFIEIIFQNHEKSIQSYHLDGYSFFPVGMGPGEWSPDSRKTYNNLDAVSRHSIQVYPKSWSAILLTFDNAGMWNLRSNQWERYYLGQQLYVSVVSPARSLRDEYTLPTAGPYSTSIICGAVKGLPMPPAYT